MENLLGIVNIGNAIEIVAKIKYPYKYKEIYFSKLKVVVGP